MCTAIIGVYMHTLEMNAQYTGTLFLVTYSTAEGTARRLHIILLGIDCHTFIIV